MARGRGGWQRRERFVGSLFENRGKSQTRGVMIWHTYQKGVWHEFTQGRATEQRGSVCFAAGDERVV